jgi:hypothetical protein
LRSDDRFNREVDQDRQNYQTGKVLRGSYQLETDNPHSEPHPAIMLVTAYIVERGLILEPYQVNCKSNEITALPPMLTQIAAKGVIFAFDAINTQKKTCQLIVDSGNDYIGALKGNQSGLLKDIEANFQPEQIDLQINKGHGRIEKRTVSICKYQSQRHWPGLETIIRVESERNCSHSPSKKELRSNRDRRMFYTSTSLGKNHRNIIPRVNFSKTTSFNHT